MKTVIINKLMVKNFKGAKELEVVFNDHVTSLYGKNGTFKSTTYDAFLWLLFGKNSDDRKDFNIKNTVDTNLNRQDHEVEMILSIDGKTNTLKRIYKEKWQKIKGEETQRYTGNETLFYWNDVPMQQKEFVAKINSIIDESVFKLITNPLAFNDLKWTERRNVLMQICGDVSDEETAGDNPQYKALVANLTQGKTMADYLKQIVASIKKAKDDLKAIPTRIDEILRSKPEVLDFDLLRAELSTNETKLKSIDDKISDSNKAFQAKLDAQRDKKIKANNLKSDIEIIEQNATNQANNQIKPDTSVLDGLKIEKQNAESEISTFENSLRTLDTKFKGIKQEIKNVSDKIEAKRTEWVSENAKTLTFNDDYFHCPTCKREFESCDVENKKSEALQNFKNNKQAKLNEINQEGGNLATQKESLEKELEGIEKTIQDVISNRSKAIEKRDTIDLKIENASSATLSDSEKPTFESVYESILVSNMDYKNKVGELQTLIESIEEIPTVNNSELVQERNDLTCKIDEIKAKLLTESQIKSVDERVSKLKAEESSLSQQIADVEKTQFLIENFEKLKMETLEKKVNSKFKIVTFKMFESQVNGGESPACEILVNGVPFSDANTASKINAGLDIINILCEYYQISAPIFIDNRESVTEIIDTQSQIVNLIVSEADTTLRVA
jgi:exonuclease SbcC